MSTFPRPAPISSASDLLMPALAMLVACVLSIICACSDGIDIAIASRVTARVCLCIFTFAPNFYGCFRLPHYTNALLSLSVEIAKAS